MKATVYILLMMLAVEAMAQRPAPDVIETSKGALKIQPLNHATLALTWNG
ncbi:MAG: MBL fold metallo-hydrolase, partial [Cytophaga sp.]|nr:MBL fold metallo-hydrolase [Cytophaga sp.]